MVCLMVVLNSWDAIWERNVLSVKRGAHGAGFVHRPRAFRPLVLQSPEADMNYAGYDGRASGSTAGNAGSSAAGAGKLDATDGKGGAGGNGGGSGRGGTGGSAIDGSAGSTGRDSGTGKRLRRAALFSRRCAKGGLEPPRELPHWNLNRGVGDATERNHADPPRQKTQANVTERQNSGRVDPNFRDEIIGSLDEARSRWRAESAFRAYEGPYSESCRNWNPGESFNASGGIDPTMAVC